MRSLEQLEGVWPEPESPTGLILRCHAARKKPIDQLSDLELATLLNQDIGVKHILTESVRRVDRNRPDDTEYFDGQLKEAVARKTQPGAAPNGGPAMPSGNSGVLEGPPSVS